MHRTVARFVTGHWRPALVVLAVAAVTIWIGVATTSGHDPGAALPAAAAIVAFPNVVAALQRNDIAVTELALRLASLDEVFMALTGHAAEETK